MYYRNEKKVMYGVVLQSQHTKFTNLVVGHKFYIVDAGKTPNGVWAKCAFCGMRLKYWIAIKREDGVKVKVGRICLERSGCRLTKEFEARLNLPSKKKKPKTQKEAGSIDDDLLRMLDDL